MSDGYMKSEMVDGVCIINWQIDHLDAANSSTFRTESAQHIKAAKNVVLDLTGVVFIDSAGLGALLSVMRSLGERNGEFRICCAPKAIQVLFELVRLHKILDIHETRADALASFAKG
jgi:anti-sigma B factor antagonist